MEPSSRSVRSSRSGKPAPGSELQGLLLMATVACMWGTSPVASRALFSRPGAPSPAVLGTVQAILAFLGLNILNFFAGHLSWAQAPSADESASMAERKASSAPDDSSAAPAMLHASSEPHAGDVEDLSLLAGRGPSGMPPGRAQVGQLGVRAAVAAFLNRQASSQLAAGAELGAMSALANAATLTGFQHTMAARGAFLLRMSVMFTPILSALAGEQTPRAVWLGAAMAFLGGLFIAGDDLSSQGQHSASLLHLSGGDAMLLLAAMLWALQTLRQGRLAPKYPPIALAAKQLGFMALGLGGWLAATTAVDVSGGQSWTGIWPGASDPSAWLIAAWPAVFPWGIGGVLQIRAQTMVSPTLTNIVMTTDPLWATLFSGVLGSNEQRLGFQGWLGGGCIVMACVIASQGKSHKTAEED